MGEPRQQLLLSNTKSLGCARLGGRCLGNRLQDRFQGLVGLVRVTVQVHSSSGDLDFVIQSVD